MDPVLQRRLESTAILFSCIWLYYSQGYSWGWFALTFFLPDLTLLVYHAGPRIGGIAYNTAHCYLWPILAGGVALIGQNEVAAMVALIWGGHVAFDRALGWGLKYPDSFCSTDMGRKTLPVKSAILS